MHCPSCDNSIDQERVLRSHRFNFEQHGQSIEYKLYKCAKCDLEFWMPLELSELFYRCYLPKSEVLGFGTKEFPRYSKPFFQFYNGHNLGRVLDIGCGDGVFLDALKGKADDLVGIELNQACIERAKQMRNLDQLHPVLFDKFVEQAGARNEKFDLITFFEVLEHQDDPKGFIKGVKKLLNPKAGMIAGSVPNRARLFADLEKPIRTFSHNPDAKALTKSAVIGDFPPPHLTRWSPKALRHLLEQEGFSEIRFSPVGLEGIRQYATWLETIFLGSWREKIKERLGYSNTSISGLEGAPSSSKRNPSSLGRALRMFKGTAFLPLAALTFSEFNRRGLHTFFQAKYVADPRVGA